MAEASRWHRGGASKHKLHYRKEVEITTTLQELLLYFIFLINLCICYVISIFGHFCAW
ncbi:PKD2L2 isoform 6 [Pan troglodytes]|uniref:PKD2L2 isoform 5 n=3 Tax=Hominidae TaxID=9604 RepID=A0A2J8VQ21_PONAB|nr:polycystin 2 like 2, transient receptor potential cation channel [Homo sapiens]KAI4022774.1 polycystin 2 like 2, transient receptor potential cation channel [Homo sapiens]PNI49858.1 PKD2L2 isoform 6 [Pan troglodytes]PNJ59602.1 PKD2L2 isoform 5 [Pongo abelii]